MTDDERSDREQVTDVLIRYATGIDTLNWPLFRTCFTDDVDADYGDIGEWHGIDDLVAFMTESHEGLHGTRHMMSNFVIDLDLDGDAASVASYVHAVIAITPDNAVDAVGGYEDRFVRTADGWRIRERRYRTTRLLMPGSATA